MLCYESASCTHTLILNSVTAQVERKLVVLLALVFMDGEIMTPKLLFCRMMGTSQLLSFFVL